MDVTLDATPDVIVPKRTRLKPSRLTYGFGAGRLLESSP